MPSGYKRYCKTYFTGLYTESRSAAHQIREFFGDDQKLIQSQRARSVGVCLLHYCLRLFRDGLGGGKVIRLQDIHQFILATGGEANRGLSGEKGG